jgi:hypothetical protein
MVLARALISRRNAIMGGDSGGWRCAMQGKAGRKAQRGYVKANKTNAIAAGKACTKRILRLTVAAP